VTVAFNFSDFCGNFYIFILLTLGMYMQVSLKPEKGDCIFINVTAIATTQTRSFSYKVYVYGGMGIWFQDKVHLEGGDGYHWWWNPSVDYILTTAQVSLPWTQTVL
jgi:hypothetical protein